MKNQALFYQKNKEKLFRTVVCYSRDWVIGALRVKVSKIPEMLLPLTTDVHQN